MCIRDRCEVFSRADVNAVDTTYNGGRLKVGEHYTIQADVGSDGTYAWVRIQAGAEKRYAVVLPDRLSLIHIFISTMCLYGSGNRKYTPEYQWQRRRTLDIHHISL